MFEIELLRSELTTERRGSETKFDKVLSNLNSNSREIQVDGKSISPYTLRRDSQPGLKNILLKGQMRYIEDIKATIYLCSPM